MTSMRITHIFVAIMLASFVVLAGCNVTKTTANNPYAKYYTGTRGMNAQFVNFPTSSYYYGSSDPSGNPVNFAVSAKNIGASFTRGAVYVSGYDPQLLVFQEIPIDRNGATACGLSIGSIGFGVMGGIFRCDGVSASAGGGMVNFNVESLQKLIHGIGERFGKSWWDEKSFDFSVGGTTGGPLGDVFRVNFKSGDQNLEYYQHGRLFIALLAGLDFTKNGGREFLLAGSTYEMPGGEEAYFEYNGRIVDWPAGLDQTTQSLLLTTCYQYTTYADPVVCIDPSPQSENRKVCTPQSRTWSGGNGAPVSVTSVEQENTPKKIIFRINVKNVGLGKVYDPGKLEKCSPYSPQRATQEDLNVVYLGDVRIGTTGLRSSAGSTGISCYPEVIRLDPKTKAGSTTCTYPLEYVNLKSAYQTPLVIELWYGYSEELQRNLLLKRVV